MTQEGRRVRYASARGVASEELAHIAPNVERLAVALGGIDYLVDEALATSLFLCLRLRSEERRAGKGCRSRRSPYH